MDPLLTALVQAGIISPADAERIHRQMDPVAARAYAEETITQAFRRGFVAQRRRILNLLDATEGRATGRQVDRFWEGESGLLFTSVGEDLRSVAIDRAVTASINATDPDMWNLVNEEVMGWVDGYYNSVNPEDYGSLPNLNGTSRRLFAEAFQRWQVGELAEMGYNRGLPNLIRALEPIFGEGRARRIAITETSRIFAESERAAARANPFVVYLQWLTSEDELVCPICGPRADRVIGKEEDGFRVPVDGIVGFPPAHVNCRCSVTQLTEAAYQALREQGFTGEPSEPQPAAPTPVDRAREARRALADRVKDVTYDTSEGRKVRERLLKAVDKAGDRARDIMDKYYEPLRDARNAYFDTQQQYGDDHPRTVKAKEAYRKLQTKRSKEIDAARDKAKEVLFIKPSEKRFGSHLDLYLDQSYIHTGANGFPAPDEVTPYHRAAVEFLNRIGDHGIHSSAKLRYEPGRAFHRNAHGTDEGFIQLDPNDGSWVAVHEMGHRIEQVARRDQIKIQRFLHDRIGDDEPELLRDIYNNSNYDPSEVAYRDRFDSAYMGKVYGDFSSTEIVSMGVQYLYQDPVKFAQEDPDYFDFIVSYMRSRL